MSIATRIAEFSDDHLNPIVVKEVRQSLRSHFISVAMLLLLLAQLLICGVWILNQDDYDPRDGKGAGLFNVLSSLPTLLGMVFLPIYTSIRMGSERSGDRTDLLYVSTITPGAIVRGKFFSAMVLLALAYSVCLPFLTFTYVLRGIDLPTIFVQMSWSTLLIMIANAAMIFVGTLKMGAFLRILLGLAALGAVSGAMGGGAGLFVFARHLGGGMPPLTSWEFWEPALLAIGTTAAILGAFYVLSVALLMPPAANRTLGLRVYFTVLWLIGLAIAWHYGHRYSGGWRGETAIGAWGLTSAMVLSMGFLVAACERDTPSRRVARYIPRNALLRPLALVFYAGSVGGLLWAGLLSAATVAVIGSFQETTTNPDEWHDLMTGMGMQLMLIFAYAGTALLLRTQLKFVKPARTWVVAVSLLVVLAVLPAIIQASHRYNTRSHSHSGFALNPFGQYLFPEEVPTAPAVIWAGITAVLLTVWSAGKLRHFRPPDPETMPTSAPADAPAPASEPAREAPGG